MKVLLLDSHTTPVISSTLTQSALLSHEVYLTDRIDNASRERMKHLKCIVLLRPTEASIEALCNELKWPKYGGYWLYFTNVLKKTDIERLAEADEHDVVKEVQVSSPKSIQVAELIRSPSCLLYAYDHPGILCRLPSHHTVSILPLTDVVQRRILLCLFTARPMVIQSKRVGSSDVRAAYTRTHGSPA